MKSILTIHWKIWCWSWSSSTLATWCKEVTHWKRPWCWERLKAAGERDDRGDIWMASPTWWTWVWANSGSWWWTGKPGVLQSMGSQRVRHDWVIELNWLTELIDLSFCKTSGVFACYPDHYLAPPFLLCLKRIFSKYCWSYKNIKLKIWSEYFLEKVMICLMHSCRDWRQHEKTGNVYLTRMWYGFS